MLFKIVKQLNMLPEMQSLAAQHAASIAKFSMLPEKNIIVSLLQPLMFYSEPL